MNRSADHSIQGFLYQFHKTLVVVLEASDDTVITVEGIIEDIDISAPAGCTAIQCKYHEAKDAFVISAIFKPLLQMMQHFHDNPGGNISYLLFAHFPNPPASFVVTKNNLETALSSTNKELKKYCDALNGKVDLDEFLKKFSIEFGPSWDEMVGSVHSALVTAGIPKGDVDTLAYPNAINEIAMLGIQHDPKLRSITKAKLLENLKQIKSTAISRWTLALKTRKQILEARRKQLKLHLDKNARLRCFIVNCASIEDFDDKMVGFVCDFLEKYHFKTAHIHTPIICLDTTEDIFRDVQLRLYRKGIVSADGYVGAQFDEARFFREPLTQKGPGVVTLRREFALRLLRWESNGQVLTQKKGDDLFIFGPNKYEDLDTQDVCVEVLESSSIKEIAFVLGLIQTYE